MAFTPRLVFVTAPGRESAWEIASAILNAKLAACVSILPGVESHYWWQGQIETAAEAVLLIKSSAEQFDALAALVKAKHPYEVPEIVAVAPAEIAPAYRAWWQAGGLN